ncbi:MAG: two component, sigma54 specific, transcriptional regulator, Fis family [Gemmatimonadetes bacterium]|nr:two component, sigma54 specific, transcriptional regulator, Fis family [Gemmatimonadota bacterium]
MNILVIDDELGLRHTLSLILQAEGHAVRVASDGDAGLERLAESSADLVICDVRMPGLDGLAFLDRYKAAGGSALVIMMSAYGDDEAALEAIRRGAYDFIAKPFRADQVLLIVRKAIEREGLRREVAQLHEELVALRAPSGVVGRSPKLAQALALADKVARHPSTALITGESGTGKELIARHIHDASPRASKPFVAVNCGAIPEALLESELFGHTRGAFTGATAERQGLFEEADGGTLFLDELGDLPLPLQVKLLRALQEGEVRRVGDNASRSVDVRVVAATARDLETDVAEGRFRADLYYRVNVVRIHLPALRERSEDVPELVRHFVDRFNRRLDLHVTGVTPAAMRALVEYPWPGNVRELENIVERAMVLTDGPQLDLDQLPTLATPASRPDGGNSPLDLSVKRRLDALERALIKEALERTRGNRTRAAKLLDLSHRALLYKIRDYGLGD